MDAGCRSETCSLVFHGMFMQKHLPYLSKVMTPFTTCRTPLYMTRTNKATGKTKLTAWLGCVFGA